MRNLTTLLIFLTLSSVSYAEELFVYERNFLQFPDYREIDEMRAIPEQAECEDTICSSIIHDNKRYFRTYLLTSDNYQDVVIGSWTGGDCKVDSWQMDPNGSFRSQYPQENRIYSWSGRYSFTKSLYIEDAINNDGEKEWNEAKLFYLPKHDIIIYKGTRSLEGYDSEGNEKYIHYEGPDFYYFKRCKSQYSSS